MTALILATAHIKGPHIDWAALSPIVVLAVGALVVLLVGLLRGATIRERVVPALTLLTLAGAIGTEIWRFPHPQTIIAGALRMDDLALIDRPRLRRRRRSPPCCCRWRADAPREAGHGEFHACCCSA